MEKEYKQIGVSRPPLEVQDLPTPEEVYKVKRVGLQELILFILGPGVIALGISIGSGEWQLGPLNVSKLGFQGIGWVILVSAVLQVLYNIELARFTIATGEPPILAFGRTPPGYWLWIPLALFSFYMAFILGGWTVSAGASLFALFTGRVYQANELELVRIMGIGLLASIFVVTMFGRKIERTMEAVQGLILPYVLIGLLLVTLVVVPISYWGSAMLSLVTPSRLPEGADMSLLGALAGFTALASGLNFMFIGYYRDKGFGMGSRTGYLPGLLGGRASKLSSVGKIFPENEKNAAIWKRWFRYLLIDQWGIYFVGAILGMMLPSILVGYLAGLPGAQPPEQASVTTYAALQLGQRFGPLLSGWTLLTGFLILYTTQMVVLELLARNLTDGLLGFRRRARSKQPETAAENSSEESIVQDPRRLYYPIMIGLIVVISIIIHLALPVQLTVISGNLSNFAALIFPLVMIYLNRQLPKPARITWWSYLSLVGNVLFFGFFFVNFLLTQGSALFR
ncbi:MAG: Nramp family divalent metal transporter [Anaerolineales bacterium]|nr:Nramp family divalent metal transporter [Anaerolineales bacterium]